MPSLQLMATVGAPDVENFYVVGEAWAQMVCRLAPHGSSVLDIGCGCGRTARFLLMRDDLSYVGFDILLPSIEWSNRHIAPLAGSRFRFIHVDARSAHYNPNGSLDPGAIRFPVADASIDVAVAASVFTHLDEPASRHYLNESARCLKPDAVLVASIHNEVAQGATYAGDESRFDVDQGHFVTMAAAAGLRIRQALGPFCGQETFVFELS